MVDWDWFCKTDFTAYTGEWIAIKGKLVVAHSKTIPRLLNLLKQKAIDDETVLIYRVPEKGVIRV